MSKIVKKMKIMQPSGTLSDYVSIGAEAENINVDGESVETKLGKKPYYYDTVADMKADTKLKAGDMAVTLGYYSVNDGGGAEYRIIDSADARYATAIDDGGSVHDLMNGNKALLIINEYIYPEYFGAVGDGVTNDSAAIQSAYNFSIQVGKYLFFQNKYLMNTPILVTDGDTVKITGNANKEWLGGSRIRDIKSMIIIVDSFLSTNGTVATIYPDISKINIYNENHQGIFCKNLILNSAEIYDIGTRGLKHIILGALVKDSHIHQCLFYGCGEAAFKQGENTGSYGVVFSDSYLHDNYINAHQFDLTATPIAMSDGNLSNFYIYNNYIDFWPFVFKANNSQALLKTIVSSNNVYEMSYGMGYIAVESSIDISGAYSSNTTFHCCSFTNDKFNCMDAEHVAHELLPQLEITPRVFDVGDLRSAELTILNCWVNSINYLLYTNVDKYQRATDKNISYKIYQIYGDKIHYDDLFHVTFTNEYKQIQLQSDIIDTLDALPATVSPNGRKIIVNDNLYMSYNKQWVLLSNLNNS